MAFSDVIESPSHGLEGTLGPYKNKKAYLIVNENLVNTLHHSGPNRQGSHCYPFS
jgi:hypothetical protein